MTKMMQGDSYSIPFVLMRGQTVVTPDMVKAVQLTIGVLTKSYPGNVKYQDGKWLFPMQQEESFRLKSTKQPTQVRIRFMDGNIVGARGADIDVLESISRGEM